LPYKRRVASSEPESLMALRLPFFSRLKSGDFALIRRMLAGNARDFVGRYVAAFVSMAIFAAATGGTAWLMRDVVDGIFLEGDATLLIVIPLAMGALFAIRGFAKYHASVILARIGNAIVARLQRQIYDKVLALEIGALARTHSAGLVARMSHHALAARDALQQINNVLIRDLLTLVVLTGVMIWQSPLMSLFILVAAPIAIGVVTRLVRRTRKAAESEFRLVGRLGALLQETAIGIRVVRAFNLEETMRGRMRQSIGEAEKYANKVARYSARTTPLMESLAGLAVAGILLWTGYAVVNYGASPGAFISFVTAMLLAYEPASRLARFNVHFAGKMVGVRLIYELLDTPAVERLGGDRDFRATRGEVVFDHVTFRYRPDQKLFDGLSFAAAAGKTTALVGPSGVGKSTVISLIERFHEPEAGRILIDGRDIAELDLHALRSQIALVGQDVRLFTGSVRENIRYGRLDATDAEVERAAAEAMADEFIRALPAGFDTELGEQGSEFSGGQRQRIAIARALLRDAPIVLLDEATSALDSESEVKVQAAFDRLKKDRTTIVIAHRLSTVRSADKILVFQDGDIVEQGSHAQLIAANGAYARFHRLQLEPEAFGAEPSEGATILRLGG
jgi:ATP-binding cassette subfamily B protein